MTRAAALSVLLICAAGSADAAGLTVLNGRLGVEGYADLRAVAPSDQVSWMDGGLGKFRYGDSDPSLELAEIVGEAHLQVTGELMVMAVARIAPQQSTLLDVTEAYLRYRPVSLSPFRWSVKLGAFFPPISLENSELGWASPWTLTPSAINTWVGEELRTLGGEARAEWRSESRTLTAIGAVYGWNDPTGILLADRGWALHDFVVGLNERPRLPDVFARSRPLPVPAKTSEFIEIDSRAGWYAGASWEETGWGRIDVLRYHNEADPTAQRAQVAWLTKFWSAGASTQILGITLLAQGMKGWTYIEPSPFFHSGTDFESAFLLAGWETGDWRFAGRAEVFSTNEEHPGSSVRLSEHGHAFTVAANWLPLDWLRLTAELVRVDSTRRQRMLDGLDPRQIETMGQLSAKLYF